MDDIINQIINLYHFSPENILALKVILGAMLLMGAAIFINANRSAKGWRTEWRETTQANRERSDQQRMEQRLRMVGR